MNMKSTGIVRRIDDLGRVVIPKELRRTMFIKEGDPLELFVDGDRIIFRKYQPGCVFCGDTDIKIAGIHEKLVCRSCTSQIIDANISTDVAIEK